MSDFCDPVDCSLPGSSVHGDFLGKSTGVGCHFLLQGIFLTQGSNLHLLPWQVDFFTAEPPGKPEVDIKFRCLWVLPCLWVKGRQHGEGKCASLLGLLWPRIVRFPESESTLGDARGWRWGGVGMGIGELVFNGDSFSLRRWKIQETDDGESCTMMRKYLVPLNWQLNMVKIIYFILCDSYQNKKKTLNKKVPQTGWLKTIEIYCLAVLEARSLKLRYPPHGASSETLGRILLCLFLASGSPKHFLAWNCMSAACLCHHLFSLWVSVSVSKFIRTPVVLGLPLGLRQWKICLQCRRSGFDP